MKRLLLVSVLVFVPAALGKSDAGCAPATCGIATVAQPGARVLAVRPNGRRGPLVAYDLELGRRLFSLPAGMRSADGRAYLVARAQGAATTVTRYDATTGRALGSDSVDGRWTVAAVSANGTPVLRRVGSATGFWVGGHTVELGGNWEAEAVSNDGRRLYLVEHLQQGYRVRLYDLAAHELDPTPLRVKGEAPLMNGLAWASVASPDGHWLLTLFLTGEGKAAVHTLDLTGRSAVCVELPSAQDFNLIQRYALVLSPDGKTVWAANDALGAVARIDLATRTVTRTTRFHTASPGPSTGAVAAISRSGRTLWFTSGSGVLAYDTAPGRVRGPLALVAGRVAGLGVSPDDRRVYAVTTQRAIVPVA